MNLIQRTFGQPLQPLGNLIPKEWKLSLQEKPELVDLIWKKIFFVNRSADPIALEEPRKKSAFSN